MFFYLLIQGAKFLHHHISKDCRKNNLFNVPSTSIAWFHLFRPYDLYTGKSSLQCTDSFVRTVHGEPLLLFFCTFSVLAVSFGHFLLLLGEERHHRRPGRRWPKWWPWERWYEVSSSFSEKKESGEHSFLGKLGNCENPYGASLWHVSIFNSISCHGR